MNVLVAGAGAVGSWLGGHMAAGGADVTLVARGDHGAALRDVGLRLVSPERVTLVRPRVEESIAEAARAAERRGSWFDVVVVAVKSYDTDAVALELVASRIACGWQAERATSTSPRRPRVPGDAGCQVVCMQNGVGNERRLAEALGGMTIVAGVLTTAVSVGPPGTITSNGKGGVGLATEDPRAADQVARRGELAAAGLTSRDAASNAEAARYGAADVLASMARGGLAVRDYDCAAALKWSKLLLNLLGSATTAILGWSANRVFSDRRLFEVERQAWLEALAVMRVRQLAPVRLPGYPVPVFARAVSTVPERWAFRLFASRLAGARGDRLPGTALDLASGKGRTEVEVLGGTVAAAGNKAGVATPLNWVLTDLVARLASNVLPREAFAGRPEALLAALADGALVGPGVRSTCIDPDARAARAADSDCEP